MFVSLLCVVAVLLCFFFVQAPSPCLLLSRQIDPPRCAV